MSKGREEPTTDTGQQSSETNMYNKEERVKTAVWVKYGGPILNRINLIHFSEVDQILIIEASSLPTDGCSVMCL